MKAYRKLLPVDVRLRELLAWAMYDFANSGYTTVVLTAVFNAYFVAIVAGNAVWATLAWTGALSLSYFLIVLTAPFVGAYADLHAAKKKLLAASTIGCVLFTSLLYFAGPGALFYAAFCLVASNFFFGTGENLIAAFLPEISTVRARGRVSGWGWGLGYLGGLFTLGLCLLYLSWAEARGHPAASFVPVTMLITAAVFTLASLPTFILLRERAAPSPTRDVSPAGAWLKVWHTLKGLRYFPDLRRFLLCCLAYQAGVVAVVTLTAVYAQQALKFTTREILVLLLAVNITAAIGAALFGHLQDRLGHIRAIALALAGWILAIFLAWEARGPGMFWAAANIAGLCLGGSQSAGRALVGILAPPSRTAEFFGFWGLAMKLASIVGPLSYGLATWLSGGDHRSAILLIGGFFVLGLVLLPGVRVLRGRKAALRWERFRTG